MNIEEFYEADERRRQSSEVELGTEWSDSHGNRYELNWIEDTGELYVMAEPAPHTTADLFGGIYVGSVEKAPMDMMTVSVIAQIETREELEKILSGWQDAMSKPGGANWLYERVKSLD